MLKIEEAANSQVDEPSIGAGITWDDLYEMLVKKFHDTEKADEVFGRLSQDYPEYKWKEEVPSSVLQKLSKG